MKKNPKELLEKFLPMTEEEQKDFFYLLLDKMDRIVFKLKCTPLTKQECYWLQKELIIYDNLAAFFKDDPDWIKEKTSFSPARFRRDEAREARERYEKEARKASRKPE